MHEQYQVMCSSQGKAVKKIDYSSLIIHLKNNYFLLDLKNADGLDNNNIINNKNNNNNNSPLLDLKCLCHV